jgi:HSP20 family protein
MSILPTLRRSGGGRSSLQDWDLLDRQMQRLLGTSPLWDSPSEPFLWAPAVDFAEKDDTFVLTAELPGLAPEEVQIEMDGNVLTLRGEKKLEREHKDERMQLSERRYGAFERSFTLPSSADSEQVSAEFSKGILRISIGKRAEARGRRIEIRNG